MLCDCFGNMLRIVDVKFVKGVRAKTGKIFYICDKCGIKLTEKEYQNWYIQEIGELLD